MLRREGGWYAIVEIRDALGDEERVLGLLDRYNTLVHPGFFYDFHREGFVVVSLLPPMEIFCAGVANLIAG
jgi:alanine-synthesizing transaminase